MLYAIDPGKNCGIAVFRDKELITASLISVKGSADKPSTWSEMARLVIWKVDPPAGDELAIEFPQVYRGAKSKSDPKDLLHLSAMVGAVSHAMASRHVRVTLYQPHEWKGQLDKDQVMQRVNERLGYSEAGRIVPAGAKTHNVFEAIGIGLKHLKRFEPYRAYRT